MAESDIAPLSRSKLASLAYSTTVAQALRLVGYAGVAFTTLGAILLVSPHVESGLSRQFWLCKAIREGGWVYRGSIATLFVCPGVALAVLGAWAVRREHLSAEALAALDADVEPLRSGFGMTLRPAAWGSVLWMTALGVRWLGSYKCQSMFDIVFPTSLVTHLVSVHGLGPRMSGLAASSLWITSSAAVLSNAHLASICLRGLWRDRFVGACLLAAACQALLVAVHLMIQANCVIFR